MTARIRIRDTGGTLRTVSRLRMRDESGTLRTIQRVRVRDAGGTLRTVFEYFTISLSTTSVTQSGSTSTITTAGAAVVTPTGGAGSLTYQWTAELNDGIIATAPSSASTTFRRSGTAPGNDYAAQFYCTVTDEAGTSKVSPIVDVLITRT